jgi:hypothetical protein
MRPRAKATVEAAAGQLDVWGVTIGSRLAIRSER